MSLTIDTKELEDHPQRYFDLALKALETDYKAIGKPVPIEKITSVYTAKLIHRMSEKNIETIEKNIEAIETLEETTKEFNDRAHGLTWALIGLSMLLLLFEVINLFFLPH